jgi:hypothetical protein
MSLQRPYHTKADPLRFCSYAFYGPGGENICEKKESNIKPEPRRFMDDGRVEMIGQGLDCEGIGRAVEMGW